jgi:hypothetical protein
MKFMAISGRTQLPGSEQNEQQTGPSDSSIKHMLIDKIR